MFNGLVAQAHLQALGVRWGLLEGLDGFDQLVHAGRLIVIGPSIVGALSLQVHVQNPDQPLQPSPISHSAILIAWLTELMHHGSIEEPK